ncbi:MAG: glutaredoxin [Spirochaetota bacterium]|nr:glutaredoxin [Spirochaetota bacterium]
MSEITLYHKWQCPYCTKVRDFMKQKGIEITLKDITEDSAIADELISIGGKRQVPCLVIDKKPMYESDDIIAWLDEKYS